MKKYISLFAGIEGFGLAAEMVGWQSAAAVEKEEYLQMIIRKRFPNTKIYDDIKNFSGKEFANSIFAVFGGFPCQPFSTAGKRQGTSDNRYLWPQMLRIICEAQPRWVVAENVRGLVNWNNGLVLHTILTDLENAGYTALPPVVLPACAVNAPHRRDRVWIIAYRSNTGTENVQSWEINADRSSIVANAHQIGRRRKSASSNGIQKNTPERTSIFEQNIGFGGQRIASYTIRNGGLKNSEKHESEQLNKNDKKGRILLDPNTRDGRLQGNQSEASTHRELSGYDPTAYWKNYPSQSPVCDGNDGVSARLVRFVRRNGADLLTEKEINKIVSKTITKVRKEAIKAGGNAVVPPLVLQLLRIIEQMDETLQTLHND